MTRAEYIRDWRKRNRERVRANDRAWVARNPEKKSACNKRWAANNRGHLRAYHTQWRRLHPVKVFCQKLRYVSAHPTASLFDAFLPLDACPGYESNVLCESLSPLEQLMAKEAA